MSKYRELEAAATRREEAHGIRRGDEVLSDHVWYIVVEIDASDPNDPEYTVLRQDGEEQSMWKSQMELIDRDGEWLDIPGR